MEGNSCQARRLQNTAVCVKKYADVNRDRHEILPVVCYLQASGLAKFTSKLMLFVAEFIFVLCPLDKRYI